MLSMKVKGETANLKYVKVPYFKLPKVVPDKVRVA